MDPNSEEGENKEFAHFQGKEAMQHMVEVQAQGMWTSSEIHGAETPGMIFAACDAARETVMALVLIACVLDKFEFSIEQCLAVMAAFACGWLFWKMGRASWLSWSRLERLHRVMDQERHEIEVNREQEKCELKALYAAKGFQGKLLDDVVDVLMADGDRLLRVMLEEEMGFRLQQNEHPLMQGIGAAAGVIFAAGASIGGYIVSQEGAFLLIAVLVIGIASYTGARLERNNPIAAIVWNLGLGIFALCGTYYFMQFIFG